MSCVVRLITLCVPEPDTFTASIAVPAELSEMMLLSSAGIAVPTRIAVKPGRVGVGMRFRRI